MRPLGKSPAATSKGGAAVKSPEKFVISPEMTQMHKLMDIATALNERGINDDGLKKYQAALLIARQSKFQREEMECLSQMGSLRMTLGEYAQAKESFKASQSLAIELESP